VLGKRQGNTHLNFELKTHFPGHFAAFKTGSICINLKKVGYYGNVFITINYFIRLISIGDYFCIKHFYFYFSSGLSATNPTNLPEEREAMFVFNGYHWQFQLVAEYIF
jgi:hypothetical protein